MAIDFTLTAQQRDLQRTSRKFAKEVLGEAKKAHDPVCAGIDEQTGTRARCQDNDKSCRPADEQRSSSTPLSQKGR